MLDKFFGKKSKNKNTPSSPSKLDPAKDPDMIRVFDEYGRELFMTKQQWRDNVLLGNLKKERDHPEQLYNLIVGAIRDGFAGDVLPYAEHLKKIDPIPSRGAVILGIVYMEINRLDDAQRVFEEFTTQYGEDGIVLTNLAKVYSHRGDKVRAEAILWHALELDPNQENGLGWYAAIQKERGGDSAVIEAYRRVAGLPRSWRARICLARDALQRRDLGTAETLYDEALELAGRPVPGELLMQMSSDLGSSGYLAEVIRITSPHFEPAIYGLQVGNNLIKANLDLGRIQEARNILEGLYAQKRPDWKQTLNYWETELAKAQTAEKAGEPSPEELPLSLILIEGPLWMRDSSPFATLLQSKQDDAVRIAILGSTTLIEHPPHAPALQVTDAPGRLSRAAPLKLAELVHLETDAVGFAIIPWATGKGFALFGQPYDDAALCGMASKIEKTADFIIGFTVDATQPTWKLNLRLIRCRDRQRLAEATVEQTIERIGLAIEELNEKLKQWLVAWAGVRKVSQPVWYPSLPEQDEQDYLVRLEQQLALVCKNFYPMDGGDIYGEREILDGSLQLCVRQPSNPTVRMLYAQMLRQMKKARPEILADYKDKTEHLQQRYPLGKEIELLLDKAYREAFVS